MSRKLVIRIVADALGDQREAGKYILSFDPQYPHPLGIGKLELTKSIEMAQKFPNLELAMAFWKQQSPTVPLRDDGRPNRPLTAYTITFESVD